MRVRDRRTDRPPLAAGELPLEEARQLGLGDEGVRIAAAQEGREVVAVEEVHGHKVGLVQGFEPAVVRGQRRAPSRRVAAREVHRLRHRPLGTVGPGEKWVVEPMKQLNRPVSRKPAIFWFWIPKP